MAAKSTTKSSKGSKTSLLGEDVQKKLFIRLTTKIKNEFKWAGDKAVKTYGKDPTKKSTLEKFNEKINEEITKKFEKIKYQDPKKVQKEYKSLADKILKDAAKHDKSVRGVSVKASKTSFKGAVASASKTSTTSKDGGSIMSTYEVAANKGQKIIDDYVKACETGVMPSDGWWASIKKFFGFGS
ncbi:uncharacterized protein LOC123301618 [Chrysoperla carnea]|uniref:uncharacterized protein LOC123301618 n=1 Tax=Chrysoperla carnea TaxID=189513 RepID=UPI001D089072|nr:uncharacterized protein LOC123301618 [Chrysoperla carnea]